MYGDGYYNTILRFRGCIKISNRFIKNRNIFKRITSTFERYRERCIRTIRVIYSKLAGRLAYAFSYELRSVARVGERKR